MHGVIVNNLIYNPGPRAIHYNLAPEEWGTFPFEVGKMTVIGNVLRAGPSTPTEHLAFMMIGGAGDVEYGERIDDDGAADDRGGAGLHAGRYRAGPVHQPLEDDADGAAATRPRSATVVITREDGRRLL